MSKKHFDYDSYREGIYQDIINFEAYNEVLSSYTEIMLTPELLNSLVPTEKVSILVMVKNSLILCLYQRLRKILSMGERDISLINLYIELKGVDKANLKAEKKGYERLIRTVLPNSYDHYKNFKYLANKEMFHRDKKHRNKKIDSPDIHLIFKDLKNTFAALVLEKERNSYSFDKKDAKQLADKLFSACVQGLFASINEHKEIVES